MKYNGPGPIESQLFDGGKDLYHYTLGIGAVFCNRYQFDVGADITDQNATVAISAVYQF